jgi:hypothetical protein
MSVGERAPVSGQSTAAAPVPTTPIWWVIGGISTVAVVVLCYIAFQVRPASNTLGFELAKTCLQVLGVAIVGGLVTLTINVWHEERKQIAQETAEAAEGIRKVNEEALERQRQQYKLRISLVDRMTRCAQTMYVVLQHIRRIQKDSTRTTPPKLPPGAVFSVATPQQGRQQLDRAYLDFSSEAAALETEIRAWYRRGRTLPDEHEDQRLQQDGRDQLQAGATAIASAIDPPTGTDELWHQIVDLLTVYYFALCGNFRVDVLATNSPHQGQPPREYRIRGARSQRQNGIKERNHPGCRGGSQGDQENPQNL